MKHSKIVWILGAMSIVGLAGCVNNNPAPAASSPAPSSSSAAAASSSAPAPSSSTPAPSSSTPAPSSSTPAPSSSTPAPSSSTPAPSSSTPAPSSSEAGYQWPAKHLDQLFFDYDGSNEANKTRTDYKWEKGKTYTWHFNCNRVETVTLAVNAMMTYDSHSNKTLILDSATAGTDTYEQDSSHDGEERLSVKANNADVALTNTATYGTFLTATAMAPLPLTQFETIAGENVISITTNANAGFRLYLGGNVSLYYDGEDLDGLPPVVSSDDSSAEPPVVSSDDSSVEPPVVSSDDSGEPPVVSSDDSGEPPVVSSDDSSEPASSVEPPIIADAGEIVLKGGGDPIAMVLNPMVNTTEYMKIYQKFDADSEFAIRIGKDNAEYWLHYANLKDGSLGAEGTENGNIALAAGEYNIYVDVEGLNASTKDTGKFIWIGHDVSYDAHTYTAVKTRANADGKPVTIAADGDAKEITIDFGNGEYFNDTNVKQAAVKTKMDKKYHMTWKIGVTKEIKGAKVYFEGDTGNATNNARFMFNQHKNVNPVNPYTFEQYPDDTAGSNADKESEDAWRYMLGVGEVSYDPANLIPLKNGKTFADAGAGKAPMYFGDIDLAQGDNLISLFQMNAGYRLTFSGKLHIRFEGDADITGTLADGANIDYGASKVALELNPNATKEYMALSIALDPEKPFVVNVADNDVEYVLKAANVKTDAKGLIEEGVEQIKVKEAGIYDIYVDVTKITGECIWLAKKADPVSFNWADTIQEGSAALDGTKFNKNATYTFKVTVAEAGTVTWKMTMKGSNGNGSTVFNSGGMSFKVKVGDGEAVDFLGKGKSYNEYFGNDQTAWVEVDFARITLAAGENTIVVTTDGGGNRVNVKIDAPMSFVY